MPELPQRVHVDPASGKVLLLLEEAGERERVQTWLEEAGYAVAAADSVDAACAALGRRLDVEVLVADARLALVDDGRVLEAALRAPTGLEVILLGPDDVTVVPAVMARGAFAYLSQPASQEDLLQHVLQALFASRQAQISEEYRLALPGEVRFEGLVGTTPRMLDVMETLRRAAPTEAPIVILGETGSGKELLARAVHESSARRNGPFVALHLHATPQGLLESELFGHKKGAFTGAASDRVGKLELADGGTLFLDELGDIPLETQTKLLRVLETRTFEPVGSNRTVSSDFRLIAATNQDIETMIQEKRFREELWYRIKVIRVELPALRERRGDIPLLVDRFVREFAARYGKRVEGVEPDAMAVLQRQPWPGNIRELRNVVQMMVVLADGPRLRLKDVPRDLRGDGSGEGRLPAQTSLAGRPMDEIEREAIRATLELTGGNRKQAADLLEIGERTLYRKIEKYGL